VGQGHGRLRLLRRGPRARRPVQSGLVEGPDGQQAVPGPGRTPGSARRRRLTAAGRARWPQVRVSPAPTLGALRVVDILQAALDVSRHAARGPEQAVYVV